MFNGPSKCSIYYFLYNSSIVFIGKTIVAHIIIITWYEEYRYIRISCFNNNNINLFKCKKANNLVALIKYLNYFFIVLWVCWFEDLLNLFMVKRLFIVIITPLTFILTTITFSTPTIWIIQEFCLMIYMPYLVCHSLNKLCWNHFI